MPGQAKSSGRDNRHYCLEAEICEAKKHHNNRHSKFYTDGMWVDSNLTINNPPTNALTKIQFIYKY
jgi:hypothetical protein